MFAFSDKTNGKDIFHLIISAIMIRFIESRIRITRTIRFNIHLVTKFQCRSLTVLISCFANSGLSPNMYRSDETSCIENYCDDITYL